MADSLGVRVGRIVSASVHALIDQVEGAMPDGVMQQTLREIDAAIDEVRTELGKAIASRHLASKRLTEQSSRHEDLSEVARRIDDATTAFNRVMAREGGSGVGRVDRDLDTRLAELDRLSRQNRVEERLATLRAKVGKA